jgi:hypothetical protein
MGNPVSAAQPGPVHLAGRRSDAGTVRLSDRDTAGLLLCGQMYGAPYDLLATALEVREDRLRGIVARWRRAGYVQTARLGPGPAWCWLTRPGLAVTGLPYTATCPALARLAHIRAVLAVRLSLEAGETYQQGHGWWRPERRIRAAIGPRVGTGHIPDAEVSWPDVPGSAYGGECWAIEAELTPKPLARTVAIMAQLMDRTADYGPGTHRAPDRDSRYDRVVYLCAPAARRTVERAADSLTVPQVARLTIRDLPPGAAL